MLSLHNWHKQLKEKHLSVCLASALTPVGLIKHYYFWSMSVAGVGGDDSRHLGFLKEGTFIQNLCFPSHTSLGRRGSLRSSRIKRFNKRMSVQSGPMNYGKFHFLPGSRGNGENAQKGYPHSPSSQLRGASVLPFEGVFALVSHS